MDVPSPYLVAGLVKGSIAMRIAVVCNDTHGGVQPYVALGAGLKAAGHEVRLVAPETFASLVTPSALDFAPLSVIGDMRAATAIAERGTLTIMRTMMRDMPEHIARTARETLAGCEGCDLVVAGIGGMITGLPAAERLGTPFVEAHLQPIGMRSDDFPGVLMGRMPRWLGRPGRQLSHRLTEAGLNLQFKPAMAAARKAIGAPASDARNSPSLPVIYGFSQHVVPMPVATGRRRIAVGYWTLPPSQAWRPPPELLAFLARPGPIVSIGFGSMGSSHPDRLADLIRNAVRRAGVRAILLSGWAGLSSGGDDDIFATESLPHEWLFPRMAAVVHHGGAGTTGAGIRSGVPSIVVPFGVDQPFWGIRVAELGVGPAPIQRKALTAEKLAASISRSLADSAMRARASALGERVGREDGVQGAVDIFRTIASAIGH